MMVLRLAHKRLGIKASGVLGGIVVGIIGCTAAFQASAQIPREDVLECGLPDGSKFVLKSKYKWYPQAKILRGDAAERLDQGPFHAEFISKTRNLSAVVHGSFGYRPLDKENSERICAIFGQIKGIPYVGARTLMLPNSDRFVETEFDEKLRLFDARKENPVKIRSQLESLNVYPSFGAITLIANKIAREQSLIHTENQMVVATFRSESLDMGKTWSDPIITMNSEIFEIGKPVLEQCFIARPTAVNGKKVDARFPDCQKP